MDEGYYPVPIFRSKSYLSKPTKVAQVPSAPPSRKVKPPGMPGPVASPGHRGDNGSLSLRLSLPVEGTQLG